MPPIPTESRPPRKQAAAVLAVCALLTALIALAGCRRTPQGFVLLPLVQAKDYRVTAAKSAGQGDGLSFRVPPEVSAVTEDDERRPVVLAAAGTWSWRGRVPAGAHLHAGAQTLPGAWKTVRRLDVAVSVRDGHTREVLDVGHMEAGSDQRWLDLDADLSAWAGREITLDFWSDLDGLPDAYRDANLVAWGPVSLDRSPPAKTAEAEPPNILFILVDTLRADHTTPYGYKVHDTTPEIQHRLADHGTVIEHAYSQAPWTLPSVISFLTGRHPGEMLGEDLTTYGVPAGVPTLAERLAALGYETGGFVANPTLHAGAGFERGFNTFYAPPADIEWIRKHADELNRHAVPWLQAHQRRRFFLYAHYIDPHDPYENPDMINGRAQFMPDYTGEIGADWIHGIYAGMIPLKNPAIDIPYIKALYDGEVHYVDRHVGALLSALDPAVLANTLIVLTADHGEELHDHGGWKHGQTLYDEQIHVPLILRWDRRIPAGRRLGGTVRLLDLAPTLVAAAGGKPDPAFEGLDLLPALTGKASPPRRPAFSEGLSGGPLRASAVLDREKLILFNREQPFHPTDGLQEYLWKKDLDRLQAAELYDLTRDPGERHNLIAERREDVDRLAPVIDHHLGAELRGLWVLPEGLPEGSRLSGSITLERPPKRWAPFFLGPTDHVELEGNRIRFDLLGGPLAKGLRIVGEAGGTGGTNLGRVLAVAATLDGKPLPPSAVRIGGAVWDGGPVAPEALRMSGWPAGGEPGPTVLRLWSLDERGLTKRRAADRETEERLRSLGYLGQKKRK
jgi:arylsulfatase A-like enzyme